MWIEVRDKESGDVWYYNKSTGQSQVDKPDDMFSMLISQENVKKVTAQDDFDTTGFQEAKQQGFTISGGEPSDEAEARGKAGELSLEEEKRRKREEMAFENAEERRGRAEGHGCR